MPEDTVLEIFVKDKDKMKGDTDLGKTSLLLNGKLEGTREHVLDLWRSESRKRGQVLIKVTKDVVNEDILGFSLAKKKKNAQTNISLFSGQF